MEMEKASAESWEMAIEAYTGLSPAIFFTVLAWVLCPLVVACLAPPRPRPRPPSRKREEEPLLPPPPLQLGEITEEELRDYDGSDPKKPLLMAIKGQIYDVTQCRFLFGPGGIYALLAGRDASRAVAKRSVNRKYLTSDLSGLLPLELKALQDWEHIFASKCPKVGTVKKTVPVADSSGCHTTDVTKSSTLEDEPTAETAGSRELHAKTNNDNDTSSDQNAEPTEKDVKSAHDHGAVEHNQKQVRILQMTVT